ncbi:MAG: cache domain-containing protein [Bacteroidales bacterium]|nr:cache domain-containing protein [Bacteroidales bacterium]
MIPKESISRKFLITVLVITTSVIVLLAAISIYVEYNDYKKECELITDTYINEQEAIVKYEVERVVNFIEFRIKNSYFSQDTIRKITLEQLKQIRFPNKGKDPGIFFVKSYDGIQMLSVSKPEIEGKDVSGFTDPDGINTHDLFMSIVNESDGGFANYSWFNPVTEKVHKKRSYIKGIPDLHWYIGAGFWFEDINSVIDAKSAILKKEVQIYIIFLVLVIIILYLIIFIVSRNISRKISDNFNRFFLFFSKASTEHVFIKKENLHYSEFNNLADSANQMISQNKQAVEELKEKTSFIDRIIDSSALSMWISDEKGTVIRANSACLEFFGATGEEVIGKYNLFKDSEIKTKGFMPDIRKVFENGEVVSIMIDYDLSEVDHVDVINATHKIVKSTFTPIIDRNGKVTNVIVQAIDLTDIKEAETELKKHRDNLEELVKERTKELEVKNEKLQENVIELERYHKLFVYREFRIKELRDKVEELEKSDNEKKRE